MGKKDGKVIIHSESPGKYVTSLTGSRERRCEWRDKPYRLGGREEIHLYLEGERRSEIDGDRERK